MGSFHPANTDTLPVSLRWRAAQLETVTLDNDVTSHDASTSSVL